MYQSEEIVKRFVSTVADMTNAGGWWVNSTREHFISVLKNVPPQKLKPMLDEYVREVLEGEKPTPKLIRDWISAKDGSDPLWFKKNQQGYFCNHCAQDAQGMEGGMRIVWARFYSPKQKKEINTTFSARCTCEASKGLKGRNYEQCIRGILLADPKAVIRIDHWCGPDCTVCDEPARTEGKKRATYQSDDMWRHRVKEGYMGFDEETQKYYPIWEHKIWATALGRVICKQLGIERPQSVIDEMKRRRASRASRDKNYDSTLLPDETIDKLFKPYGW